MKKLNSILLGLIALVIFGISSCKDEIVVTYQDAYPVSGTWWVTYQFDDGSGNIGDWYGVGYTKLFIYNTAFDNDSIWIDDHANFWDFKVKLPYDDVSFAADSALNVSYDIKVNIKKGKVIDNDSIYMELEFEDDPGTIYICSGVRYDGFGE